MPETGPKGNRSNLSNIKQMPAKNPREEITPGQGTFALTVTKRSEIHGVEMGVLSDGTPFLTQRGLARLCGVENAHIGTISSSWNDEAQKPRITTIKRMIEKRSVVPPTAHIECKEGGRTIYAYTDVVCLAVLEYYAFEAGSNVQDQARDNFRLLAGKALQDFIYTQIGYDPNNTVPLEWKQFHDRVSLAYDAVPTGYFSVFKEIADLIVTLGQSGLHIDHTFVPDGSVGSIWSTHWQERDLEPRFGARRTYEHNYPSYFPQALSNPQSPWCYPEAALPEFRRWFREDYIGKGKFKNYIDGKVKRQELPASFAQLAIAAYTPDDKSRPN